MARLNPDQKRWLNYLETSPAYRRIQQNELLLLLYAIKRRHTHIPEESLAVLYCDLAGNLRDAVRAGTAEGTTQDDLKDECNALIVQLGALAAALTRRQRGRPPPSGNRDPGASPVDS